MTRATGAFPDAPLRLPSRQELQEAGRRDRKREEAELCRAELVRGIERPENPGNGATVERGSGDCPTPEDPRGHRCGQYTSTRGRVSPNLVLA